MLIINITSIKKLQSNITEKEINLTLMRKTTHNINEILKERKITKLSKSSCISRTLNNPQTSEKFALINA